MTEPSHAPLFRLGSVPVGAEEFRAFFQRRIRTYLAFAAVFWSAAWLLTTGLALLTAAEDVLHGSNALRVVVHFVSCLALAALWAVIGRHQRHESSLRALDLATTLVQSLVVAAMVLTAEPLIRFRPDAIMLLAMTYLLVARAAVVPSSAARTALAGAAASLPVCIAILFLYRMADAAGTSVRAHFPGDRSTPELYFAWSLVFSSLSIAVSTFVSAIIFGLQREVQRARQLGQYTLEREIGSGGMGVVFLGRHALLRRPTAVKVLLPERSAADAVARFEREVQITSRLTHPNTVAVYDYGRTLEGAFYYAMEYLDGVDLETLVESDGAQPPGRVLRFLEQIAGALAEAHAHGLIHRDIKPSNVIVCERGLISDFVKVVDFGLARAVEGAAEADGGVTQAGQITGTPLYMAPEQIQRPDAVDGRADLYALGALGYYLCTGRPVFSGATVVEICAHHLCSPVVPPSTRLGAALPPKFEALLLRCLEKDPGKRPRDAAELLSALEACDDVPAWTASDARRWWQERSAGLKAKPHAVGTTSLAVALTERAEAS